MVIVDYPVSHPAPRVCLMDAILGSVGKKKTMFNENIAWNFDIFKQINFLKP